MQRSHGRLSIFNGRQRGKAVIYTHIFTAHPFFSSFVIPFSIRHIDEGAYGKELSCFNAGCPAPEGSKRTVFPLALASFALSGGRN